MRNVSTQQDFDKAVSTSDTVSLTTLSPLKRSRSIAKVSRIGLHQLMSVQAAVYFWAHWCQPCKQLDEVFAELAKDSQQAAFLRVRTSQCTLYTRILMPC